MSSHLLAKTRVYGRSARMGNGMAACVIWMVLGAAATAAQLGLDCAAPERSRALIEYARLSEIEQVEDIHRDALDKALARCPTGAGGEACHTDRRREADLDWERKMVEIKIRYDQMQEDFAERCRASIALARPARRAQMRGGARPAAC